MCLLNSKVATREEEEEESSPPVPFHLAVSKVIIVSTPLRRRDELEPHYASIRIHCVNMFVNKEI